MAWRRGFSTETGPGAARDIAYKGLIHRLNRQATGDIRVNRAARPDVAARRRATR